MPALEPEEDEELLDEELLELDDAAPLDELEDDELLDDELEDEDELEEDPPAGGSSDPPQAKSVAADTSTPANFMVRITSDSDCFVNISVYLVGIRMTELKV